MPTVPATELEAQPSHSLRRRLAMAVVVVFVGVAVAAGIGAARKDPPGPTTRAWGAAPEFSLPSVRDGEPTVSLERFRGKPVVLNFFASWCTPCQRELPGFTRAAQRYRGKVAFVGVTFNERLRSDAAGMLDRAGVRYPAGFDAKSDVAVDYGLRVMPTTYFISAGGQLLERAEKELTESELSGVLERLFEV